ncbi:MAG: CHAP domain-containing protein [Clostridiales bacterium]|nr:CHAP domain-containing protein [Clostridiales bacterium]
MKIIKILALFSISLLILIMMFPVSAFAEDSEFEPRLTPPSSDLSYYSSDLNVFTKSGYGMPNCTAYVFGRIYEITGAEPLIKKGNAGSWWKSNIRNGFYEYGSKPEIGAIVCWSNHVAVVEQIDGNIITISQSHWGGNYFDTQTVQSGSNRYGQKFYGYIYACRDYFEKIAVQKNQQEEKRKALYKTEEPKYETAESAEKYSSNIDITSAHSKSVLINSVLLQKALSH